ncbi:hydroxypyruvate isomerase family protein [Tundrisphaera sp. TA3]|uniref:hydroxypyruvate isomerase family protein n=1 Tax=Tundrisphaera sp. TA3 TaxID=3435775 RepID=UPI003EB72D44
MSILKNGRINQSLVYWCYEKYWDFESFIGVAKELGCTSIELVDPKYYPLLVKNDLTCAISWIDMGGEMPFLNGFCDPKNHDRVIAATKKSIDESHEHGFRNVISFTGMANGIDPAVGATNCVEGFKKVVEYAERKGVTLCLEMLNSRDEVEMKGHPGYLGDHTDYCIDIIKRVGSPALKLLFDFYHVQIMDGDLIRRVHQHKDYIGHIHTAGNPGRCELDNKQEINYPPLMQALIDVGYKGHVAHEFIPTRDAMEGLREAVRLCDV